MVSQHPLRIEMVLPTLVAAGMETVVARLTRGLAQRGHEVSVTCIQAAGVVADALRSEGFEVRVVSTPGLRSNVYPGRLVHSLRRARPAVVHVHSGAWLKAARAAHLAGVPHTVHTAHGIEGSEPWFTGPLWRVAARYTDLIVAVSEPLRVFLERDVGLRREKLRLIPNGVDTASFQPGAPSTVVRGVLGMDHAGMLVGNVARLAKVKNHALLLDAFAILRNRVPDARLAIVGEGPLHQDLQDRIVALGLESDARLVGPAANMADVYRDFDLFVLSSNLEGTSLSLLEAMASGVCVVATAVGGNADLLGHGKFGVLVQPNDPTALAMAMADLLRDPARRARLAATAREHVAENYSELTMVRRYEELYQSLCARPQRAAPTSRGERVCAE